MKTRTRAAACWFALALGLFTFETALHSVHHLGEPREAAQCQALSVSQHVTGAAVGTADVEKPILSAEPALPTAPDFHRAFVFHAHKGRAPPSS